jgi:hypothetical protein
MSAIMYPTHIADELATAHSQALASLPATYLEDLAVLACTPTTSTQNTTVSQPSTMDEKLAEAYRIEGVLQAELHTLGAELKASTTNTVAKNLIARNLAAIDSEEVPVLWTHGFTINPHYLYDALAALIANQPVRIELSLPELGLQYAAPSAAASATSPWYAQWATNPQPIIDLGVLLRCLSDSATRFAIQESPATDPSSAATLQLHTALSDLRAQGVPTSAITRYSQADLMAQARTLVGDLAFSADGNLTELNGQLCFAPRDWLQKASRLVGDTQGSAIALYDIPNHTSGLRADSVLAAASRFLQAQAQQGPATLQLHISESSNANTTAGVYALLRAAGRANINDYHHLTIDSSNPCLRYAFVKVLLRQTEKLITACQRAISFQEMAAADYAHKNYETMMEQDKELIRVELDAQHELAQLLGVDFAKPETLLQDGELADICLGPNLYPIMLSTIFTNGYIRGLEYARSNRMYMQEVGASNLDTPMWKQFEDYIVKTSKEVLGATASKALANCHDQARQKLRNEPGDVRNLSPQAFRFLRMEFGAESNTDQHLVFREMMRSVAGSLKPKDDAGRQSVFVGYFITNSNGWGDGDGNTFPGVPLSLDDIVATCLDVGLDVRIAKNIGEQLNQDDLLRPGEGMAFIAATPRD